MRVGLCTRATACSDTKMRGGEEKIKEMRQTRNKNKRKKRRDLKEKLEVKKGMEIKENNFIFCMQNCKSDDTLAHRN